MSNKIKGVNVLVCGSQRFESPEVVFNALETFFIQSGGNIRKIFTSKFSGSCEFARKWAETRNQFLPDDKKIEIVDYLFDNYLEKKNNTLFNEIDLPAFAVQESPFFQEGKEMLIAKGVNLVMAFPNKEGVLGVSTLNIARAAELANIKVFNCAQLLQKINNYKAQQPAEVQASPEEQTQPSLGFKNRHPNMSKK